MLQNEATDGSVQPKQCAKCGTSMLRIWDAPGRLRYVCQVCDTVELPIQNNKPTQGKHAHA